MAVGDRNTLNALRNPARRLAAPREPSPPVMMTMNPARPFDLNDDTLHCLRGAIMTCEHLQPVSESDRDSGLLCQVANLLARGHVPHWKFSDWAGSQL